MIIWKWSRKFSFLNTIPHGSLPRAIIAHLINTNEDQLTVHVMNISKQSGTTNFIHQPLCPVWHYAKIRFKKEDLWAHLLVITEKEHDNRISVFPKVKSRILRTEVFDVHCICRMPMMDQRWCAVILVAINGFILLVLKILIVEINGIALCVVMRNHNCMAL